MEKLPIIEMSEISNYVVASDDFQNVFSISEIDAALPTDGRNPGEYSTPVRLNTLLIVLILQGNIKISVDYVPYKLTANSFLTIMPAHIFQVAECSSDFQAIALMVGKSFLDECNPEMRSPSMTNYMLMRSNPCSVLLPEDTDLVLKNIRLLRDKVRMRSHSFHKELLQNAFIGFLLELANLFIGKKDAITRPTFTRKEEILNQFLELLILHVKTNHVVTFYADKLFITPQYLSLILKELTGKSANKWIDEALMVEAKIMLKMPQITVQQVADKLNFSDQSTFGKFFKKHQGVSPLEFRRS